MVIVSKQLSLQSRPLKLWFSLQAGWVASILCNAAVLNLKIRWFAIPLIGIGLIVIALSYAFASNRSGLADQFTCDWADWSARQSRTSRRDMPTARWWRTMASLMLLYGMAAIPLGGNYLAHL